MIINFLIIIQVDNEKDILQVYQEFWESTEVYPKSGYPEENLSSFETRNLAYRVNRSLKLGINIQPAQSEQYEAIKEKAEQLYSTPTVEKLGKFFDYMVYSIQGEKNNPDFIFRRYSLKVYYMILELIENGSLSERMNETLFETMKRRKRTLLNEYVILDKNEFSDVVADMARIIWEDSEKYVEFVAKKVVELARSEINTNIQLFNQADIRTYLERHPEVLAELLDEAEKVNQTIDDCGENWDTEMQEEIKKLVEVANEIKGEEVSRKPVKRQDNPVLMMMYYVSTSDNPTLAAFAERNKKILEWEKESRHPKVYKIFKSVPSFLEKTVQILGTVTSLAMSTQNIVAGAAMAAVVNNATEQVDKFSKKATNIINEGQEVCTNLSETVSGLNIDWSNAAYFKNVSSPNELKNRVNLAFKSAKKALKATSKAEEKEIWQHLYARQEVEYWLRNPCSSNSWYVGYHDIIQSGSIKREVLRENIILGLMYDNARFSYTTEIMKFAQKLNNRVAKDAKNYKKCNESWMLMIECYLASIMLLSPGNSEDEKILVDEVGEIVKEARRRLLLKNPNALGVEQSKRLDLLIGYINEIGNEDIENIEFRRVRPSYSLDVLLDKIERK